MTGIALVGSKNRPSELLVRVEAGESFVIARLGKAVARLVRVDDDAESERARKAIADAKARREGVRLGRLRSRDSIADGRR